MLQDKRNRIAVKLTRKYKNLYNSIDKYDYVCRNYRDFFIVFDKNKVFLIEKPYSVRRFLTVIGKDCKKEKVMIFWLMLKYKLSKIFLYLAYNVYDRCLFLSKKTRSKILEYFNRKRTKILKGL